MEKAGKSEIDDMETRTIDIATSNLILLGPMKKRPGKILFNYIDTNIEFVSEFLYYIHSYFFVPGK